MREFGVRDIVFSSSATVYGIPQILPVNEEHPAGACTNPYGRTKYFIEQIFSDVCHADPVTAESLTEFCVNIFTFDLISKHSATNS